MTEQHGHANGRAVPPLATFTFANGAVARLRPVSQFTRAHMEIAARTAHPAPPPPLNAVDYGDGKTVMEPNAADPDYQAAMQQHQVTVGHLVFEGLIELGVEIAIDQAALNRVTETLARLGMPLDEKSDKIAYIKHCCMFDLATEGPALRQAMEQLLTPRQGDVDAQLATFPADVPRA